MCVWGGRSGREGKLRGHGVERGGYTDTPSLEDVRELKRRERRVSLKGLDDGFENVLYDEVTGYDFQAWQATDIHCLFQVKTLNYCEGAAAYMRGVFLFFLKRLLILRWATDGVLVWANYGSISFRVSAEALRNNQFIKFTIYLNSSLSAAPLSK